jgi:hypothetical protein
MIGMARLPAMETQITLRQGSDRMPLNFGVRLPLISGLLLYAVLRASWVPSDGAITGGFSHDSAYLSIVAPTKCGRATD